MMTTTTTTTMLMMMSTMTTLMMMLTTVMVMRIDKFEILKNLNNFAAPMGRCRRMRGGGWAVEVDGCARRESWRVD